MAKVIIATMPEPNENNRKTYAHLNRNTRKPYTPDHTAPAWTDINWTAPRAAKTNVINAFEVEYLSGHDTGLAAQNLASMAVYSVRRKIYNASGAVYIRAMQPADIEDLQGKAIITLYDLCARLDTSERAPGMLERKYIKTVNKRSVYYANEYGQEDWTPETKEVETSIIQEVYGAIRREIAAHKSGGTGNRRIKLDYIDGKTRTGLGSDWSKDSYTYTDAAEINSAWDGVYLRSNKYADLGGYEVSGHMDAQGKETAGKYTADASDAMRIARMLDGLGLTEKQLFVVKGRTANKTYDEIAKSLGITRQAAYNTMLRVQQRCIARGYASPSWLDNVSGTTTKTNKANRYSIVYIDPCGFEVKYKQVFGVLEDAKTALYNDALPAALDNCTTPDCAGQLVIRDGKTGRDVYTVDIPKVDR